VGIPKKSLIMIWEKTIKVTHVKKDMCRGPRSWGTKTGKRSVKDKDRKRGQNQDRSTAENPPG